MIIQIPKTSDEKIDEILRFNPVDHPKCKNTRIQKEYLLFFLHLLNFSSLYDFSKSGFVKLSSKRIREWDSIGEKYLQWLTQYEFLEEIPYSVGTTSKSYRIKFKYNKLQAFEIKNAVLNKKIQKKRNESKNNVAEDPFLDNIFKKMQGVKILPSAYDYIKNNPEIIYKDQELQKLDIIERMDLGNDFWLSRGQKVRRIYSPMTSIKKEIRQNHITIDGEIPFELDIPCCHPQLLVIFLEQQIFKPRDKFNTEITKYKKLFSNPHTDFYQYIINEYNNIKKNNITRKKMKILFMSWLFSKLHQTDKTLTQIFRTHFPLITSFLFEYKNNPNNNLACDLQNIESNIILDSVAVELLKYDFSFITIHDCIIVPSSKQDILYSIWSSSLSKFNIITQNSKI